MKIPASATLLLLAFGLIQADCTKAAPGNDTPPADWSEWKGDRFTVNDSRNVEDCILRRSDMDYRDEKFWTAWNFGASQVLDAGYSIAMWNMWHGNVLVRFDLRGIPCGDVAGATLRLYAPANITQMSPEVPVAAYRVKPANRLWREGSMESLPEAGAASWQYCSEGREWAGGMNGCGVAGVDHDTEPLGISDASKYEGQWLEYDIPKDLVRTWLEHPEENAGLVVKVADKNPEMGDHVLFYSSEHPSGKGPELIIYGHRGKAKVEADPDKKFNPRDVMPPQGSQFEKYLAENDSRYKKWILDPAIGLTGDARIYPYYWNVYTDGSYTLPYAYYPLSMSIADIEPMMASGDIEGLRRWHTDRLRYLHLWEYIREQRWYDCGDLIEHFSPRQAALLWLGSRVDNGMTIDGILNKIHPKGTKNLTEADIASRMDKEWNEIDGKVKMTPEQKALVEPFIREMERLRCLNYNICNDYAQQVHALLASGNDGTAMIDALGGFMNYHDIYLYYDSYYQIKRCAFLLDNTDLVSFTAFWKQQKFGEYSPRRITNRFRSSVEYWPEDRTPIAVENKNIYW